MWLCVCPMFLLSSHFLNALQMNVFYNVESARDPTEKLQAGTEAFSLDVEVLEALDDRGDRHHTMVVSICTR